MFCNKCGTSLSPDEKFCHVCGNTISGSSESVNSTPVVESVTSEPINAGESLNSMYNTGGSVSSESVTDPQVQQQAPVVPAPVANPNPAPVVNSNPAPVANNMNNVPVNNGAPVPANGQNAGKNNGALIAIIIVIAVLVVGGGASLLMNKNNTSTPNNGGGNAVNVGTDNDKVTGNVVSYLGYDLTLPDDYYSEEIDGLLGFAKVGGTAAYVMGIDDYNDYSDYKREYLKETGLPERDLEGKVGNKMYLAFTYKISSGERVLQLVTENPINSNSAIVTIVHSDDEDYSETTVKVLDSIIRTIKKSASFAKGDNDNTVGENGTLDFKSKSKSIFDIKED